MIAYLARRSGYALVSLVLLAATIFVLIRFTGDPAALLAEPGTNVADLEALRERLGLNRPMLVQFISFLGQLPTGDFGNSFYYGIPVLELFAQRLPNSFFLAGAALLFSLALGLPLGILGAVRPGGIWDRIGRAVALLGLSMPAFWIGLILLLFFGVYLRWFPTSGSGTLRHVVLPAVALGWYFVAANIKLMRSAMLEVLQSEYIRLARLKGLPDYVVIGKHALKNALIPIVTLTGINFIVMVNVGVIVETVFSWPGIGRLLYEGILFRDFPVVQGAVLLGGFMIIVVNLLIDLLYAAIDPRIRLTA